MSVYVIVDDGDTRIEYTPMINRLSGKGDIDGSAPALADGWVVNGGGVQPEFLQTTSGSGKATSTMSYVFSGSSISVYGTLGGLDTCGACIGTNLSFSIDDHELSTVTLGITQQTLRHVPIFNSPSLLSPDSTHTLTMEILTSASSTAQSNLFFDYIIYDAAIDSTIATSGSGTTTSWIFVDDQSPYLVFSTDGWNRSPEIPITSAGPDGRSSVFNSSVSLPTGSSSTVSLAVAGVSRIQAFGLITESSTSGSLGTYSINNGTSDAIVSPNAPTQNYALLNQSLDPSASHTIVITADSANAFYLDYILLESSSAYINSPSSNSTSATSTGGQTSTPTASGSSTSAPTVGGANVGAIAGGVVGGVVALLAVGVAVYIYLRRRQQRDNDAWHTYYGHHRGTFGSTNFDIDAPETRVLNIYERSWTRPDHDLFHIQPFGSDSSAVASNTSSYPPVPLQAHKPGAHNRAIGTEPRPNMSGQNPPTPLQTFDTVPAVLGGTDMSTPRPVVIDSDSGLRGIGDDGTGPIHLPPLYSLT